MTATSATIKTTDATTKVESSLVQLRITQVEGAAKFTLVATDAHLSVEHNPFDELSYEQQILVSSKLRPAL
ncbi:hypothetical protein JZU57_02235, partial [bacterium]|nr:hypothetical protein [bacterium]